MIERGMLTLVLSCFLFWR